MSILFVHISILILLVLTTLLIVRDRNLSNNIVYLGLFSMCMSFMFVLLNAPDVALTEAAVGAGLSTVIYALGIGKSDVRKADYDPRIFSSESVLLFFSFGITILAAIALPAFGDGAGSGSVNYAITQEYASNTLQYMGDGMNMVTALLADFRGYDTLGETFVVFVASLSVLLVLAVDKSNV